MQAPESNILPSPSPSQLNHQGGREKKKGEIMITHEEAFTSPFPSPSRTRGRTRFVPEYDYSPPSNNKHNMSSSAQKLMMINGSANSGSAYRRSNPIPVVVSPVPAPSFSADHQRLLLQQHASRLNVPYDVSVNTSSSTIKAATTFTSATKTTKQSTPPHPHPHPTSSTRKKRTTERIIEDEDFQRLQASLESLQKTLKHTRSLLRESERNGEWWKERVKVLDKRSGGLEVENHALSTRVKELEDENRILREQTELQQQQLEEEMAKNNRGPVLRENPYAHNIGEKADHNHQATTVILEEALSSNGADEKKEKDKLYTDAIRGVITQYWNMQTSLAIGAAGTDGSTDGVCDCAAARTVQSILLKQSAQSSSSASSEHPISPTDVGTLGTATPPDDKDKEDVDMADSANGEPPVRIPPHPHPEVFAKLRKVRKKVLRKRVREMKGYIEALRGENEVLERVIHERGDEVTIDFDITKL